MPLPWWVELWLDTTMVLCVFGIATLLGLEGWYVCTKWREARVRTKRLAKYALALAVVVWIGAEVLTIIGDIKKHHPPVPFPTHWVRDLQSHNVLCVENNSDQIVVLIEDQKDRYALWFVGDYVTKVRYYTTLEAAMGEASKKYPSCGADGPFWGGQFLNGPVVGPIQNDLKRDH